MEPGGLWWTNVLNSALPPKRHRPDTQPEHQDPVSHTEKEKKEKKYIYRFSQSPLPQFWDGSLSIQVFHRCRVYQVDCGDLIHCSWGCSFCCYSWKWSVCHQVTSTGKKDSLMEAADELAQGGHLTLGFSFLLHFFSPFFSSLHFICWKRPFKVLNQYSTAMENSWVETGKN